MAITVEKLAKLLSDSFELDGWGDVNPYLFSEIAEPDQIVEDSDYAGDVEALRRVLQRVVIQLNTDE